ncbi:MAG: hypothetical protein ABSD13_20075 [Candidatus Korobacteraceae bacterium]
MMPKVMEAQPGEASSLCEATPCRPKAPLVARRVKVAVLTGGEDIMLRFGTVEPDGAFPQSHDDL